MITSTLSATTGKEISPRRCQTWYGNGQLGDLYSYSAGNDSSSEVRGYLTLSVECTSWFVSSLELGIRTRIPNLSLSFTPAYDESPNYDARIRQFGKAKLWSAPNFWGHRATFRANPPAQLTIQDIRESDEGVYRCRVDFRNSPTRNFKVNFTVIECDRIKSTEIFALTLQKFCTQETKLLANLLSFCKVAFVARRRGKLKEKQEEKKCSKYRVGDKSLEEESLPDDDATRRR
ncbi:hypothetical protein HZH68_010616 [Vespula germanica]|uniref:Ig-like domain-containing protein n=1 Tax=Vespula germanica TaxID=30212 RepID=A0A834N2C3_VESGE|nr:hypothetical protein HZH68_010616 [Vespula germanica]